MPTEQTVECKIIISHFSPPLKEKYGITIERLTGDKLPGWDVPRHLRDDAALFKTLFGVGFSALEIAEVTKQLEKRGASYLAQRQIDESALTANGF